MPPLQAVRPRFKMLRPDAKMFDAIIREEKRGKKIDGGTTRVGTTSTKSMKVAMEPGVTFLPRSVHVRHKHSSSWMKVTKC